MKEKRSEGNRLKKRNTLYWMPSKIINGQGSSTMKARMIEFTMMIRAVSSRHRQCHLRCSGRKNQRTSHHSIVPTKTFPPYEFFVQYCHILCNLFINCPPLLFNLPPITLFSYPFKIKKLLNID